MTCVSLIVQIHLHLVNIKITYKNIDIFYIDPLSDLRPDLGASGYRDFDDVASFAKFKILTEIQSRKVSPGLLLGNYSS